MYSDLKPYMTLPTRVIVFPLVFPQRRYSFQV